MFPGEIGSGMTKASALQAGHGPAVRIIDTKNGPKANNAFVVVFLFV